MNGTLFDVLPAKETTKYTTRPARERLCVREVRRTYIDQPTMAATESITEHVIAAKIFRELFNLDTDPSEQLACLYLDSQSKVIAAETLFRGTVTESTVSAREPICTALLLNASSLILAHNHPSGNPSPSPQDIATTAKMRDACALLGLRLLDHIIIAGRKHLSMKEKELF